MPIEGKTLQQCGRSMTPNVRGEAGPTVLGQARAAHVIDPWAPRGPGPMPLGLASTEGLGVVARFTAQ
jgi:hypothetical protein